MINSTEKQETPLQQKLNKLGKTLGIAALAICAVIFFIGLALLIIISFVLIQMPLMNKTAKRKVLMGKIISFLLSLLLFFYGYQLIMEVLSV